MTQTTEKSSQEELGGPQPPDMLSTARGVVVTALQQYGIVVICVAMFLVLALTSDVFLTSRNLTNILDQWAVVGMIACAGTFVLICGGFDLSVGAMFALGGVTSALVAQHGGSALLAILCGVAAGACVGLVNALAFTVVGINPLITTLATALITTGIAVYISNGQLIAITDPHLLEVGQGRLLGLTIPGLVLLVTVLVAGVGLSRTTFGYHVFAVGGNTEAARLSGVRVRHVHSAAFIISGAVSGLAGVLAASRIGTGQADVGTELPMVVISAIVVGGTSIYGGEGAVWRTFLGVLLFAMIGNGFTLLGVNSQIQQVVQGLILLGAVGLDSMVRRRT
jgi:ribose transport system permease protein